MTKPRSWMPTFYILAYHRLAKYPSVSNNYTPCASQSSALTANLSLPSRTNSQASRQIYQSHKKLSPPRRWKGKTGTNIYSTSTTRRRSSLTKRDIKCLSLRRRRSSHSSKKRSTQAKSRLSISRRSPHRTTHRCLTREASSIRSKIRASTITESYLMKSRLRATPQIFQHHELLTNRYQEGQTLLFRDFSRIGNPTRRSQDASIRMPLKTQTSLQFRGKNCVS